MNHDALEAARRIAEKLGVRTVAARYMAPHHVKRRILHERIMELIAEGMSNKDIADALDVSPQAVGRHRRGEVT